MKEIFGNSSQVALMTKKESLLKTPVVLSQIPNTSKFLDVSVRKKSEWRHDRWSNSVSSGTPVRRSACEPLGDS